MWFLVVRQEGVDVEAELRRQTRELYNSIYLLSECEPDKAAKLLNRVTFTSLQVAYGQGMSLTSVLSMVGQLWGRTPNSY